MRLPNDVEDLHLIAEHHTACRTLRRMGWGGVAFGILNIGLGVFFVFALGPVNALLAFIGLLLLGAGVWCLALPGAEGAIANGVGMLLVGLWNFAVTFLNLIAGAGAHVWPIIFGVFAFGAAVQSFKQYARFSAALRHGASADELKMMDDLVQTILKANPKEDEDIITFRVRVFPQEKEWRGQLGRDVAFFVEKMSKEVLVAHRGQVNIEPHGKVLLGKTLKATVRIRQHRWEAMISPEAFDRFRDWKFAEDEDDYYRGGEPGGREPETGIRATGDRREGPPTGIRPAGPGPEDNEKPAGG
ncbi:MAG TPA: hypothetical protein VFA26_02260 [Gemmataceae bacterium]|nr:hypothetical protein [Gemmataceae bacterium]